jgi:hypothetical protein
MLKITGVLLGWESNPLNAKLALATIITTQFSFVKRKYFLFTIAIYVALKYQRCSNLIARFLTPFSGLS